VSATRIQHTVFHRLILTVATGFGLGYAPVASGTFGSLPGVPLALGLATLGAGWQAAAALALALLAVPVCDAAERLLGGCKDDRRIVADEWMLLPLAVVGLPLREAPWLLLPAFLVARACDILKPPPAARLQRLRGGLGIVIDDFFAALYALAINHALWQAWQAWRG
jgi:phosphatidylglycerophosphatase A